MYTYALACVQLNIQMYTPKYIEYVNTALVASKKKSRKDVVFLLRSAFHFAVFVLYFHFHLFMPAYSCTYACFYILNFNFKFSFLVAGIDIIVSIYDCICA